MIYLYAITDPLRLPAGATGLEEAPLEVLEEAGVCGVYSTHEGLALEPEASLLWRHEQVVEGLMELAGVLPVRFGTMIESAHELRAILRREERRFRRLLPRVRGCVELAVRVGLPHRSDMPAATGAAYLESRLAARREREGAANRVLAPLRELANATSHRNSRADAAAVSESFLVPRDAVDSFVARVRALQARNQSLALSCTGPWGPYSFVEEIEA